MTRQHLILIAAGGSAALLLGAFVFQYFGYAPCQLCLWQRWPHAAAILIGAIGFGIGGRILPAVGGIAALTTAGIGLYHTGVERKWWLGPASCTGNGDGLSGLSGNDLLSMDGPKLIMCDQVSWEMFGLSMASWNMVFSLVLVGFWIAALRRS